MQSATSPLDIKGIDGEGISKEEILSFIHEGRKSYQKVKMRLEHVAFNVHDPAEVSAWYVAHLGMVVLRTSDTPLRPHFLADSSGFSLLEFYHNANVPLPDYAATDPYTHHIAFAVSDIEPEVARLVAAGAITVGTLVTNPDGDGAQFLRDPWGLALQLVQRAKAML